MNAIASVPLADLAASVGPSVVGLGAGARGGSGAVVAAGRVVTLARNLRGERVAVQFQDARREEGRLLGTDPDLDLAVLEVDTGEAPAIPWATGGELPIGSPVVALGDPGGRGLRVTAGAVAGAPRRIRGRRGRVVEGLVEHTAPLPRGSGGGPLVDPSGALLGLNAIREDGGLILALPAAPLRRAAEAIQAGRAPRRPRLGVAIAPPRASRRLREAVGLPPRDGVLVREVDAGSLADRAGVARGDLIVALGDRPVGGVDDLYAAVDALAPGDEVRLSVVRGVEELTLATVAETEPQPEPGGPAT